MTSETLEILALLNKIPESIEFIAPSPTANIVLSLDIKFRLVRIDDHNNKIWRRITHKEYLDYMKKIIHLNTLFN